MDPWVQEAAAEIGRRAPRELEALVGVGDDRVQVPEQEDLL